MQFANSEVFVSFFRSHFFSRNCARNFAMSHASIFAGTCTMCLLHLHNSPSSRNFSLAFANRKVGGNWVQMSAVKMQCTKVPCGNRAQIFAMSQISLHNLRDWWCSMTSHFYGGVRIDIVFIWSDTSGLQWRTND